MFIIRALIFAGILSYSNGKAGYSIVFEPSMPLALFSFVRAILFLYVGPCRQNVHEAATDHVAFLATGETKRQSRGGVQRRWQEKGGRRDLRVGVYVATLRYMWRRIIFARLRRRDISLQSPNFNIASIETRND